MDTNPRLNPALRKTATTTVATVFALFTALAASAGPEGGTVVRGSGSINQTAGGGNTVVTQNSNRLAINWSSFNVGVGESVQFIQPSSSAIALNRIGSENGAVIQGSITANGRVFLLSPAGVLFTETAHINVNSLFASTLDMDPDAFMSGNYSFASTGGDGAVINRGLLQAANGGSINLVGGTVRNEGVILANFGQINLAAGRSAVIDFDGDGLIQFQVSDKVLGNASGAQAAVSNSGVLQAEGGLVAMSARVADQIFAQAVNNEGVISARGVSRDGGRVYLTGEGGDTFNSGTIDVSSDTGEGGTVHVLGDRVALTGAAVIDASGATGGGEVRVGGGFQGGEGLQSASQTIVQQGVTLAADAGQVGDGGTIIVWSEDFTQFYGNLSATGGENGGDGGFAEISGHSGLVHRGTVDLSATSGAYGVLLLDPEDIVITAGTALDGDDNPDASNTNIQGNATAGTVAFADTEVGAGPYVIYEGEIEGTDANIVLQATDSITTSGTFTLTLATTRTLTLTTDNTVGTGGINLTGMSIVTQGTGSSVTITTANGAPVILDSITTGLSASADITVNASGLLTILANATVRTGDRTTAAGSSAVTLTGGTGVVIGSNATVRSGDVTAAADGNGNSGAVQITATTGNISVGAGAVVRSGNVSLQGGGGTRTIDSGDVVLTATAGNIQGTGTVRSGNTVFTSGEAGADVSTSGNVSLSGVEISADGAAPFTFALGTVDATAADAPGSLILASTGTGAAGDIRVQTDGNFSLSSISTIDTDDASTNTIMIALTGNGNVLTANDANFDQSGQENDHIVLVADDMVISAGIDTSATTTLSVYTDGRQIDLGTNTGGQLGLTDAELDLANGTGTLIIGSNGNLIAGSSAGTINVTNAITTQDATTLHLVTGGAVTEAAGGTITETNLAITAAATSSLNENNTVTNLAATVSSGNLTYRDTDGIAFSTINGVTGVSVAGGNLVLNTAGAVTQTAGSTVTVSGNTQFVAGAGNSVTLNEANNFNTVQVTSVNNLSLTDASGITFNNAAITGNLTISTSGAIAQTGATALTVGGTSSFTAGANTIIVAETGNDFGGAVSFSNSGANNVAVADSDDLVLGTSGVGTGTFSATAVGITQTGILTQAASAGTATFSAGAGQLLLTQNNEFTGTVALSNSGANNAAVTDATGIVLGNVAVGTGTLAVTAGAVSGGGITQAGGTTVVQGAAAGTATFNGGAGVIVLTETGNNFTGAVLLNNTGANLVSVIDSVGGIDLGTSSVGQNLIVVSSNGDITDSGTVTVVGDAGFTTTLADADINLGTLAVGATTSVTTTGTGGDATVVDNSLSFGVSNVGGNLLGTATTGNITQGGQITVGGNAGFTTSADDADITLATGTNTVGGAVSFTSNDTNAGNQEDITWHETGGISIGTLTQTGTLTMSATTGNITQTGGFSVGSTASFTTVASDADIVLTTANTIGSTLVLNTSGASGDASFTSAGGVDFQTSAIGGGLTLVAAGAVVDTGTLSVGGTTSINTSNVAAVTLDSANDLNTVTILSAASAELADIDDVTLGAVTLSGGLLEVDAGTSIAITGAVATDSGAVDLAAGTGLTSAATGAITTTGAAGAAGGAVTLTASNGSIVLDAATTIDTSAADNGAGAGGAGGLVTLAATDGSITAGALITSGGDGDGASAGGDAGDIDADTLASGGSISFGAITATGGDGGTTDGLGGDVDALNTGASSSITFAGAVDLGSPTPANIGSVTADAQADIIATGAFADVQNVTFTAGNLNSISLDNAGNNITGTASFAAQAGTLTNLSFTNSAAIDIAATTLAGNLTLVSTGGGITDSGALVIAGTTSLTTTGFDIVLNNPGNDFTGAVSADTNNVANAVTLVDTNAIVLGNIDTGDLNVTAGGSITNSATATIVVDDLATLDATTSITLGDVAGDSFNAGRLDLSGVSATIVESSGSVLADADLSLNLNLTSAGAITQTGALAVTGTATFDAGANAIDLTTGGAGNDFGFVSLTTTGANNATVTDSNGLDLFTSSVGGDLTAIAGTGDLTDSGTVSVGGDAAFTTSAADADINLGTWRSRAP